MKSKDKSKGCDSTARRGKTWGLRGKAFISRRTNVLRSFVSTLRTSACNPQPRLRICSTPSSDNRTSSCSPSSLFGIPSGAVRSASGSWPCRTRCRQIETAAAEGAGGGRTWLLTETGDGQHLTYSSARSYQPNMFMHRTLQTCTGKDPPLVFRKRSSFKKRWSIDGKTSTMQPPAASEPIRSDTEGKHLIWGVVMNASRLLLRKMKGLE